MIEANLHAVIQALTLHIRDFRGAFSVETFEAVYEFCTDELLRAYERFAPVVEAAVVPVVESASPVPVEEVKA